MENSDKRINCLNMLHQEHQFAAKTVYICADMGKNVTSTV